METRLLGIPTVTDRLLQQAMLQIIMARFEFGFSQSSFGFRPYRSLHQAVLKAQNHINDGQKTHEKGLHSHARHLQAYFPTT
jgi:RNA-directed DNA polymerase